jgi:lysophospholipase L1-like esterase
VLDPWITITNNGTKGNPCLVADIFGDFREEILLRTQDSSAIRIYTNTEITNHKLFTLMHDTQYRCGIAWQNNCYNQPCYPKFYYASDMDYAQVLPETQRKPVIYIAGDSTAQSYSQQARPQFGWGEKLLQMMDNQDVIQSGHRLDCSFEQEMYYENRHLIVDNCAMAGRSSKSFREEGRLDDIQSHLKMGDYLLIQFGHNDAAKDKPERYVPVEEFAASLQIYIHAAKEKGAIPVLISSICLRMCSELEESEAIIIANQLPKYAKVMEQVAKEENLVYIDMGALTKTACEHATKEETAGWYREDNVHLALPGAERYAQLLVDEFLSKTEQKWRI